MVMSMLSHKAVKQATWRRAPCCEWGEVILFRFSLMFALFTGCHAVSAGVIPRSHRVVVYDIRWTACGIMSKWMTGSWNCQSHFIPTDTHYIRFDMFWAISRSCLVDTVHGWKCYKVQHMRCVFFPIGTKKWSTKGAHLLARHSRPQKVKPHCGASLFLTRIFFQ